MPPNPRQNWLPSCDLHSAHGTTTQHGTAPHSTWSTAAPPHSVCATRPGVSFTQHTSDSAQAIHVLSPPLLLYTIAQAQHSTSSTTAPSRRSAHHMLSTSVLLPLRLHPVCVHPNCCNNNAQAPLSPANHTHTQQRNALVCDKLQLAAKLLVVVGQPLQQRLLLLHLQLSTCCSASQAGRQVGNRGREVSHSSWCQFDRGV